MSDKIIVASEAAPKAIGPYSQAVWAGDLLFCSGQTPIDPVTGKLVSGGVEAQTRQVIKNITAVLEGAGLTLAHVVKSGLFIKDMNQFAAINAVYAEHFPKPYPARTTVEVARLPMDALVELEVVAKK